MVWRRMGRCAAAGGAAAPRPSPARTAIERDLRTAIRFGRKTGPDRDGQGGRPHPAAGRWHQAAAQGDPLVLEVLYRTGSYLGQLAASVVNLIDPEMVIFGGGLIEACADQLMPTIRGAIQVHLINRLDIDKLRIEVATLGDHAGVLGAAMLARSRFD
jgi:glucokinase